MLRTQRRQMSLRFIRYFMGLTPPGGDCRGWREIRSTLNLATEPCSIVFGLGCSQRHGHAGSSLLAIETLHLTMRIKLPRPCDTVARRSQSLVA
jgi:hypothetical protein